MSLKRRVVVVVILVLLAGLALGLAAYISLGQYKRALHKEQISSQIASEIFHRRLFSSDYILYPTERAKAQWLIKQQAIEQLVNDNAEIFTTEAERPYIQNIKQNTGTSRKTFNELLADVEAGLSATSDKAAALTALLSFNAQSALTDATKLQEFNHQQAAAAFNRLTLLVVSSSLLFLAVLGSGFWYVWRSALEMEQLDKIKDEFLSLASHQLRTPLTSIMLNSHMLDDGYAGKLTAKQQKLLNVILFSTDRMTELVTVLLNIARMEAGRVNIESISTDMHLLLKQILEEQQPRAKQKEINLIDLTKDTIPSINTDQSLVKELYSNLITNAIKYTPESGEVTVQLQVKDGWVYSYVRDNGYGIAKKEQSKIFTKFYRGTNIIKKDVAGTGLGLYLLKLIAERLHGKVGFNSSENKGSEFWFALPLAGIPSQEGSTRLEQT